MSTIDASGKLALSRTLQLLNIFRDMDKDMPVGQIVTFVLIAQGETPEGGGLMVSDVQQKGEFALSSASRYMKALGKTDRHGKIGQEVISEARDPLDDRRKVLRLTAKGHRTVEKIQQLWRN